MINTETANSILQRYKKTDARCRYLNDLPDVLSPESDKSLNLFIRGMRRKVLAKKLIDITILMTIP